MATQYYINLHTRNLVESIRVFHKSFPINSSVSSIDILVLIIQLTANEEEITLKKIYNSVPYAENTVRNFLRQLAKEGWINFVDGHVDHRVVCVEMTPKFYKTLIELNDKTIVRTTNQ